VPGPAHTCEVCTARPAELPEFRGGDRRRPSGRAAMPAANSPECLLDRGMLRIKRVAARRRSVGIA